MKKTNLLATLPALILTAFMAACADDHATDNDQKQNPEKVGTVFIGTNTIKIADNPATRTSLDLQILLQRPNWLSLHQVINIQTRRYRLPFAALIVGHLMQ